MSGAAALPRLVLASASTARAGLLSAAGIDFATDPADIDENALKTLLADNHALAQSLAEAKAQAVSARHPGALVIGADQVLDCGGLRFDKPADRAAARGQLLSLRGRAHCLLSGVAVARDGATLWRHVECARLTMRNFSDDFLDAYLEAVGDEVLSSVGAYHLEGRGIQLFAEIEGDYFAILGLPLLPLLNALRRHGAFGR